jgi:hypothetical protein
MHHLVLGARRHHAGLRRLGTLLEAHEHLDLGPELLAVELESFLTTAIEEQVGLDLHGVLLVRNWM